VISALLQGLFGFKRAEYRVKALLGPVTGPITSFDVSDMDALIMVAAVMNFTTSAVVANRGIRLQINDNFFAGWFYPVSATQAASQVLLYTWGWGTVLTSSIGQNFGYVPIVPAITLSPLTLQYVITAGDVADTLTNMEMHHIALFR